jgi:hypothetical protein
MVFSIFWCGTIGKFEAENFWQWVSIYAGEATANDPSSDNKRVKIGVGKIMRCAVLFGLISEDVIESLLVCQQRGTV